MPETIQTRLLHLTSKNEIGWQSVASPSEGYSDVCVSHRGRLDASRFRLAGVCQGCRVPVALPSATGLHQTVETRTAP